jgi:hypothetical protein
MCKIPSNAVSIVICQYVKSADEERNVPVSGSKVACMPNMVLIVGLVQPVGTVLDWLKTKAVVFIGAAVQSTAVMTM